MLEFVVVNGLPPKALVGLDILKVGFVGCRLACCAIEADVNDLAIAPGREFLVETGAYGRVKAVEL